MANFYLDDVTFLFKFKKFLNDRTVGRAERAQGIWKKQIITKLKSAIELSLDRGLSPVENAGDSTAARGRKYKVYSDSYKKMIRNKKIPKKTSVSPVNLKVTGDMRDSLRGRPTLKGILLFYTSPIAKYHNDEGAGKSRIVRQILPKDNQKFTRSIDRMMTDNYTKIFNRLK